MLSPKVTVVCEKPDCAYQGIERTVSMVHLGQDVYGIPSLRCVCDPTIEPRIVGWDGGDKSEFEGRAV